MGFAGVWIELALKMPDFECNLQKLKGPKMELKWSLNDRVLVMSGESLLSQSKV